MDGLILISSFDADFGLVPAAEAHDVTRRLAAEDGVVVTLRCPISDAVMASYEPPKVYAMERAQ